MCWQPLDAEVTDDISILLLKTAAAVSLSIADLSE